jgi:hypothetical protein
MNHLGLSAGRTWLPCAGIAAAALGAAISVAAASASAGQVPPPQPAPALIKTVTLPPGTTVASTGEGDMSATVTKSSQSINARVACALNLQRPHRSAHVPRRVEVTASIKCTGPVKSLGLNVILRRNGKMVTNRIKDNSGQAEIHATAAKACVTGKYRGEVLGEAKFRPPQKPPTNDFGLRPRFSAPRKITC